MLRILILLLLVKQFYFLFLLVKQCLFCLLIIRWLINFSSLLSIGWTELVFFLLVEDVGSDLCSDEGLATDEAKS